MCCVEVMRVEEWKKENRTSAKMIVVAAVDVVAFVVAVVRPEGVVIDDGTIMIGVEKCFALHPLQKEVQMLRAAMVHSSWEKLQEQGEIVQETRM